MASPGKRPLTGASFGSRGAATDGFMAIDVAGARVAGASMSISITVTEGGCS